MKDLDENRFYVETYLLRLVIQNDRKQISNATGVKRIGSLVLNTNRSKQSKYFVKDEIEKFIPIDFFTLALDRTEPFLTDLLEIITLGGKSAFERKTAKSYANDSKTLSFDTRNMVYADSRAYFIFQPILFSSSVHAKHNNLYFALK